jgi:hypothetical protein
MDSPLPDLSDVRVGCCSRNHKRAALLFDNVTTGTVVGEDTEELNRAPDGIIGCDARILAKVREGRLALDRTFSVLGSEPFTGQRLWEVHRDSMLVEIARLCRAQGAQAAVLDLQNPAVISVGPSIPNDVGITAALEQIPVAIDSELSWEQVADFRRDSEAQRKYRELHFWLEHGMNAKSKSHATDIIEQKIGDYRWAIRKHGIKTRIEVISSIFALSSIVPTAGGIVSNAAAHDPLYGALAGGGLVIAGVTAWAAKRNLELEDIKRGPNREVAYLYELQKLVN